MSSPNWKNRTVWVGDNLDVLRGMNSDSVDLVYLDPPFNSNQDYAAPIGSEAAGAAFKDTWTLDDVDVAWVGEIAEANPALYAVVTTAEMSRGASMQSYLTMMAVRLLELKRVLKPAGSIYLHCDPTAGAYLRQLMDVVFGGNAFRNEIIWKRTSSHNSAKRWGPVHDTILFYGGPGHTWNRVLEPLSPSYVERFYRHEDERGRFRVSDLTGAGPRKGDSGRPWRGVDPGSRHWALPAERALPEWFSAPDGWTAMTTQQKLDALDAQGLVYWPPKGSKPAFKRYLTPSSGAPVSDIVLDIGPLSKAAKEKTGYPTQKPLALLDRILRASSNEGDVVLDPFCGCATTLVAAERLDRRWVGIDLSSLAVRLVKKRLRDEVGVFGRIVDRADVPRRTDLGRLPHYRTHRHTLYGKQEGRCTGCRMHFPFRNLTVDHIVPKKKGGSDHLANLQLLCGACNSKKGTGSQEELVAWLVREGVRREGAPA